jgi:ribosomal protein S6
MTRTNSTEEELGLETPVLEAEPETAEMRVYELGFHLDAELSADEIQKAYQDLKDLVSAGKGSIVAEGEPGKIHLAYTISRMSTTGRRDFDISYFGWIVYENDGPAHTAVLEALKDDLRVFRFIDLRTTKEAAQHSAEMHEFYRTKPQEPEETDELAVDVELDAALKEAGAA